MECDVHHVLECTEGFLLNTPFAVNCAESWRGRSHSVSYGWPAKIFPVAHFNVCCCL